jgi:hypothetical protein
MTFGRWSTTLATMTEKMLEKRKALQELTKQAQAMVNAGTANKVNDALIIIYEMQGHTNCKSFNAWKREGYTVKKGEKALLLWGQPQKYTNKKAEADQFFPLAFVFSDMQVEKTAKDRRQSQPAETTPATVTPAENWQPVENSLTPADVHEDLPF